MQPVLYQKSMTSIERKHWMQPICLQQGNKGYRAFWKHIMNVSVTDLKKKLRKV